MQIAAYLKTSLIEWPGKISSVIFVSGCNFTCPFCHNPDLVNAGKNSIVPLLDSDGVLKDLKLRKQWSDAVVVTGGEPTLQKDLILFLKKMGELGYLRMIHTNGTRPDVLKKLIDNKLVEYIAMDVKGDFGGYGRYTKVQSSKCKVQSYTKEVKISLKLIAESGIEFELRTTVVPTLHTIESLLLQAGEIQEITKRGKDAPKWFLQQFRSINTLDKSFLKIKPFSKEELLTFQKELQKVMPKTMLRGV